KGLQMKEVRANNRKGLPDLVSSHVARIGIEKRGDSIMLFVSNNGEPMHQVGDPIQLHIDGPFYVGIGFCSHLPAKTDTAVFSNVVLENKAGQL
ncbi:MAG TPA: biopolymer transporter Tol, partial [Puia sp.]|nr:biopolymer transporter Tol [Puia sp.]